MSKSKGVGFTRTSAIIGRAAGSDAVTSVTGPRGGKVVIIPRDVHDRAARAAGRKLAEITRRGGAEPKRP